MLLFVLSALTIFHFAVPATATNAETVSLGLLWTAIVFTALLGLTRAFVPEREQGVFDALVLAPSDRSAIWAREGDLGARVPRARRARRAAGVRRSSSAASAGARSPRSPSPTSASAPSGR